MLAPRSVSKIRRRFKSDKLVLSFQFAKNIKQAGDGRWDIRVCIFVPKIIVAWHNFASD